MKAASSEDLSRARFQLRNMKSRTRNFGAQEHGLQQALMEKKMAAALNVKPPNMDIFLTEQRNDAEEPKSSGAVKEEASGTRDDLTIARSGDELHPVKRIPIETSSGPGYRVDR